MGLYYGPGEGAVGLLPPAAPSEETLLSNPTLGSLTAFSARTAEIVYGSDTQSMVDDHERAIRELTRILRRTRYAR